MERKGKSLSRAWLLATPWTAAYRAPLSMRFSRQEYWSGLPFPSPMHESEKWKWSSSVVSDPQRPHGLQPTRLLSPWDFPGKSTGVGFFFLVLSNIHCLDGPVCWFTHPLKDVFGVSKFGQLYLKHTFSKTKDILFHNHGAVCKINSS